MKRTLAVFLGLAAVFAIGIGVGRLTVSEPSSPVQNKHLVYVLEQIRHARFADQDIGVLSLAEFGMGARPDPSYLLFRYVAAVASPPTLMEMLKDKSAAVRVTAAMVILKERRREMGLNSVDFLLHDNERIVVFDSSCFPREMSVGDILAGLKKHSRFMDIQKEEPGKTSESAAPSGRG